jgi:hypothetical protein
MNVALAFCRDATTAGLVSFDEAGVGGNCFLNHLPDKPALAVMVKDTGGNYLADGRALGYDEPTLQLLVRGTKDPRAGQALAQSLYDHYHALHAVTLDPTGEAVRLIDCGSLQSAPAHIGTDPNGRHLYSLNLALHVRNATPNRE